MHRWLGVIPVCMAILSALGQSAPSSQYQPGTIMSATVHHNSGEHDTDVTQYDVSVKVGDTTYLVLYTPPRVKRTGPVLQRETAKSFEETYARR